MTENFQIEDIPQNGRDPQINATPFYIEICCKFLFPLVLKFFKWDSKLLKMNSQGKYDSLPKVFSSAEICTHSDCTEV